MLVTKDRVEALLSQGKTLVVGGDEALLASLPKGAWIGGTIPYFMNEDGGKTTRELAFVDEIPAVATKIAFSIYDTESVSRIGAESPDNGYSIVILPAFGALHQKYALEAPSFPDLFLKVIAGWVAGIHLDDLGKASPKVFLGTTGEVLDAKAVAVHVTLPAELRAQIGIVNIFEQGDGDALTFPSSGFSVK
jgi:hypothetical protein